MPAVSALALAVALSIAVDVPDAGAVVSAQPPSTTTASPDEIARALRARVEALGTYRLRFTKEERMKDGWVGPQVMELVIREKPYAVAARVVSGPNEGRRFLYDVTQRKDDLRVRATGLMGLTALWIDVDSPLTRDDTRHAVTELGFGYVLSQIDRDAKLAKGAHTRVDEGTDPTTGAQCSLITAPPGVQGLYAQKTRLCVDPKTHLITRLEVWDDKGLAEKFRFQVLEEKLETKPGASKLFDLEANGL